MTGSRKLSPDEVQAYREARIMAWLARGFTLGEIAARLEISKQQVARIRDRVKRRIPADDTKQWRTVQLLRLERLMEACYAVLDAHHVVVSNGHVVQQKVLDDEGKPIWDPVYGPDGEPLTDDKGEIRVEMRMTTLEDQGPVLEAVAELRKLEAEVTKLLGTQIAVKQAVEVQHVDYTITGVDMSKVTGANLTNEN